MKKYFLFLTYAVICMLIAEVHPFSKYPMYSSFPNYSYTFYVADGNDSLIPFKENFKVRGNEVAHTYYEICDNHNFKRGFGVETDSQLAIVGCEMLEHIIRVRKSKLPTDSISLHRIYYLFEGDKIKSYDKQLCKRKVD
jgi:hypothetical protein